MAKTTGKTPSKKKDSAKKKETKPLTPLTKATKSTKKAGGKTPSVKKPKLSPKATAKTPAATKTKLKSVQAEPSKVSAATRETRKKLKPTKSTPATTKTATKSKSPKAAKAKTAKSKVTKRETAKPKAATTKAGTAAPKTTPANKIAGSPKAAKQAEDAHTSKEKETKRAKSEVAKKLIQSKVAQKKTPASKAKPIRPIAFTLDEALEIAKNKSNEKSEKSSGANNTAPQPPAVREKQKKEIQDDVKQENRVLGAASVTDILGYNPNSGPKKDEASEIPAKFSRYYKLLLELREHVVSGLDMHTRDTLKRSAKEDSGDLSAYSQHMADAGTETFDRDFALSLVSSEQDALYEIEDAIRRIKKGTYGVCEITGKPIKKERLLAVPFAKYSVEGQAEFERNNKKSAYRGGAFGDTSDESVPFMDEDSDE